MSKSTSKERKPYSGFKYIAERERMSWDKGEFRCFGSEDGKERCKSICEKCRDYYSEK